MRAYSLWINTIIKTNKNNININKGGHCILESVVTVNQTRTFIQSLSMGNCDSNIITLISQNCIKYRVANRFPFNCSYDNVRIANPVWPFSYPFPNIKSSADSISPLSYQTSCTPTKSNVYFANTLILLLSDNYNPLRVWAASLWRFRDPAQGGTAVGRTPLDEWSARRRDLHLTTHTTLTKDNHPCPRRDSNPQSQ